MMVSVGVTMSGSHPVGDTTATLRSNGPGTPPPLPLLRAESEIGRAGLFDARLAVALGRSIAAEVGATYGAPTLGVRFTGDAEAGESASSSEKLSEFGVEVNVFHLLALRLGPRLRPHVLAGGGYLRQLHEGRVRLETGSTMHAGGGVLYWFRGGPAVGSGLGLRAEARLTRRSGGIEFANRSRIYPTATVLAFVGF
jgi:hypothetical protein